MGSLGVDTVSRPFRVTARSGNNRPVVFAKIRGFCRFIPAQGIYPLAERLGLLTAVAPLIPQKGRANA